MTRKRMLGTLLVLTVVLLALGCQAHAGGAGSTGANFLKVAVGPRAAALGEAYTAVADDGSALYWNPAGLTRLPTCELFASYNVWFQDISQGYIAYGSPFGQGAFGFALNYVDLGTMQGYDEDGLPTTEFGASDLLLQTGYARELGGGLSVGVSGGYLKSAISGQEEAAFTANIGIVQSFPGVDVGLAIQNIGSTLGEDPLPLTYRAGIAKTMGELLLAADVVVPNDNDIYACGGVEFGVSEAIALRAGYHSGRDIGSGLSAGLGLNLEQIGVDYAYVPYAELGDTHRFSVRIYFD